MVAALRITNSLLMQMLTHVKQTAPEEACGLVAGKNDYAERIFTITNELHSPVRFRMSPEEQLGVFLWLEENDLELVAIFHSHPEGPPIPSPTDLAEFAYPGCVTIICFPDAGVWKADGFLIENNTYHEVSLIIE